MARLDDMVTIVTGAASGIGRGMAEGFAAEGMSVVLADVESEPLARTTRELEAGGARVVGVECDVTRPEAVEALAERALSSFGAVHVLCNNAGVIGSIGRALWEESLDEWDWIMGVNVRGVVHGIRAFVPAMLEGGEPGHIVNTASTAGLIAPPGFGAYATTKHAVVGLTETLFYELQGTGVGVTAVCPMFVRTGIFNSERNRPASLGGAGSIGARQKLAQEVLGAEGKAPEEVAACVHDAITADRLYAFPHEETAQLVQRRWDPVTRGENPPPTKSLFD